MAIISFVINKFAILSNKILQVEVQVELGLNIYFSVHNEALHYS